MSNQAKSNEQIQVDIQFAISHAFDQNPDKAIVKKHQSELNAGLSLLVDKAERYDAIVKALDV
jgi:hypothetical protein